MPQIIDTKSLKLHVYQEPLIVFPLALENEPLIVLDEAEANSIREMKKKMEKMFEGF